MALSDLSSAQLSLLIQLIKQKEELQSRITEIDGQLVALETGETERPKKARRRRRKVRGGKTSDLILAQLTKAGKAGSTVKELASATGAKGASIAVWLYTAGKKVKGLRKVARGRFAYKPVA